MKRLDRRSLQLAATLMTGFLLIKIFKEIDVYTEALAGDYVVVPYLHFAGLFDIGEVWVRYSGGASIMFSQPSMAMPNPQATLFDDWVSGHLQLICYSGHPEHNEALLVSHLNTSIRNNLFLSSEDRMQAIHVLPDGIRLTLATQAVSQFLDFMAATPFPHPVHVSNADPGKDRTDGLYDIPTNAIQKVRSSIVQNGNKGRALVQPPSEPYRVMRRFCGQASRSGNAP